MRIRVTLPELYVFNLQCPRCGKTSRKEVFGTKPHLYVRCLTCELRFIVEDEPYAPVERANQNDDEGAVGHR